MPSETLEFDNDFEGAPRIFMVGFVELEGFSGSLDVDVDNNQDAWSCCSEDCGDGFLDRMEVGIVHFSPIAEIAVSALQHVELLVPSVVNNPYTADSAILQFGAISIYDDGWGEERA